MLFYIFGTGCSLKTENMRLFKELSLVEMKIFFQTLTTTAFLLFAQWTVVYKNYLLSYYFLHHRLNIDKNYSVMANGYYNGLAQKKHLYIPDLVPGNFQIDITQHFTLFFFLSLLLILYMFFVAVIIVQIHFFLLQITANVLNVK